jgi:DeoR family suf operon transcriptional repressor
LLDTLADQFGQEQMQAILRQQWQRKALEYRRQLQGHTLAERVAALAKLRQAEGYMAEFYPVEPANSAEANEKFVLTEYNCAISNVAKSFPGVCGHELEMFALALGDCLVERTHWINDGEHRCGYLIQAQS